MGNGMRLAVGSVTFALTLFVSFAQSAEKVDFNAKRIDFLIEALASTNEMPERRGPRFRGFDESYDKKAQATVYLAAKQLAREGTAAFDALIAHFDDKRYSFSYEAPSGVFHSNVGALCHEIMRRAILCYDMEIPLLTSKQTHVTPWDEETMEDWWQKNRERELWDLQLEAIDWQLKFQKELKYDVAPPSRPLAKKRSVEDFERIRQECIEKLEQMRVGVVESRSPYFADPIKQYHGSMTGLPWPIPSMNR